MMRSDIDSDVFLLFQLREELSGLSEVVSDEGLTTVILDVLPEEMYSAIEV